MLAASPRRGREVHRLPCGIMTPEKDPDKCAYPRCRQESDIMVKGVGYCAKHNAERLEREYQAAVKVRDIERGVII